MPAFPLHRRWSAHLRNHRKLLIADGRRAFTGGMNIGKKYMGPRTSKEQWRDIAAVIEGPALPDLQALFLDDWAFSTGETLPAGVLFPPLARFAGGDPPPCALQIAASGPDRAARPIYEGVFAAFTAARRRLWIETPYFVPDDGIGAALRNAALRGVDVRLIVPGTSDLRIVSLAGRSYFDEMMEAGVRIHLYRPTNLHAKVLVVDDDVGVIGSPNVPVRSPADRGARGRVPRGPRELGAGRPRPVRAAAALLATARGHLPDLLPPVLTRRALTGAGPGGASGRRT
jgi:cardiolipin synthase